jgi:predicted transcriptional regulator of viral defense system
MEDVVYKPRTLGPREAEVMAWLETERPAVVDVGGVAAAVGISREYAGTLVWRLERKGWLQRLTGGRYEPLLGDSGGWATLNPWGALDGWVRSHYVSFSSAAYELGLTPDRPADVQVATVHGAKQTLQLAQLGVRLVRLRRFSLVGSEIRRLHGHEVRIAGFERCVLDSAGHLDLAAGVFGLSRVLARASESMDWELFVRMASESSNGARTIRRVGALLEILDLDAPTVLRDAAGEDHRALVPLDNLSALGKGGPVLDAWGVVVNVSPEAIREELWR